MCRRSRGVRSSTRYFVPRVAVTLALVAWSVPASAYRPFDGTDAAVAKTGEMEIELQPAGRLRDEGGASLIAPAWVINYGLSEGWEAVFEGQGQTPLSPSGPTSLTAAGAFLKHVIVPGSLQDKTSPSIATEFGVLLPDSTGNAGAGLSLAGIVSQRWDWGTIHLNAETALTRDHHGDVFLGAIHRGAVDVDSSPCRRSLLRERVWEGGDVFRFGRLDLPGARRSELRRRSPSCTHRQAPGERNSRRPDLRFSAPHSISARPETAGSRRVWVSVNNLYSFGLADLL